MKKENNFTGSSAGMETSIDNKLFQDALHFLKELISIPSYSKEEAETANLIETFFTDRNIYSKRELNNVWAANKYFNKTKPTVLLNSHHDTVKPNSGYTNDPFTPREDQGKLYGLGSNDAGGSLVALLFVFVHFYEVTDLPFNLVVAATAEEEISGHNGIEYLLPFLPGINCGIVGEPTLMKMAVAEKGLLVLDCIATGVAGHAARDEGVNSIYLALQDIEWFRSFRFDKSSPLLGDVHMAVTSIDTVNKAHNIVPSACNFTADIRVNELYTLEEVLDIISSNVKSQMKPRSTRLRPSFISDQHPLVAAGNMLNLESYGSPTCSDKALMPFPTLKMGPGDSARSHMANEYIYKDELTEGISTYTRLLLNLVKTIK